MACVLCGCEDCAAVIFSQALGCTDSGFAYYRVNRAGSVDWFPADRLGAEIIQQAKRSDLSAVNLSISATNIAGGISICRRRPYESI